jgi:metal-responsive CopG/Arc/MetJ family transcriptional regulator
MATSDIITGLPEDLQLELEKTARAQGRPVGEVLSEAVSAYLNERSWQNLIESGRNRTRDLGITEEDVPRLIAETRSELSQ